MDSEEQGYYTRIYNVLDTFDKEYCMKQQLKNILNHYTPYHRPLLKKCYNKMKQNYNDRKKEYLILSSVEPTHNKIKPIEQELYSIYILLNKCSKILSKE